MSNMQIYWLHNLSVMKPHFVSTTILQYMFLRFCLHFEESREDLERRKQKAKECHIIPKDEVKLQKFSIIKLLSQAMLEVDIDDVYIPDSVLDMPKRPAWSYDMTKAEVSSFMKHRFYVYRLNSKKKTCSNCSWRKFTLNILPKTSAILSII